MSATIKKLLISVRVLFTQILCKEIFDKCCQMIALSMGWSTSSILWSIKPFFYSKDSRGVLKMFYPKVFSCKCPTLEEGERVGRQTFRDQDKADFDRRWWSCSRWPWAKHDTGKVKGLFAFMPLYHVKLPCILQGWNSLTRFVDGNKHLPHKSKSVLK